VGRLLRHRHRLRCTKRGVLHGFRDIGCYDRFNVGAGDEVLACYTVAARPFDEYVPSVTVSAASSAARSVAARAASPVQPRRPQRRLRISSDDR
jgi:hypothetical protein